VLTDDPRRLAHQLGVDLVATETPQRADRSHLGRRPGLGARARTSSSPRRRGGARPAASRVPGSRSPVARGAALEACAGGCRCAPRRPRRAEQPDRASTDTRRPPSNRAPSFHAVNIAVLPRALAAAGDGEQPTCRRRVRGDGHIRAARCPRRRETIGVITLSAANRGARWRPKPPLWAPPPRRAPGTGPAAVGVRPRGWVARHGAVGCPRPRHPGAGLVPWSRGRLLSGTARSRRRT
jgi:hypothetical protein